MAPTTFTAPCARLNLDGVLERLLQHAQQNGEGSELERRLLRDEYQSRIKQLQQEIEAEIRRRLVADRGAEAMAKTLPQALTRRRGFHACFT